jgi:predicted nucleic acid-binding protein
VRAYIDSDVLIWHLRGDRRALACLRRLRDEPGLELWTGALQRAEIGFHMRAGEEETTLLLLDELRTAPVDHAIVDLAGRLYRRWHPSHGVDIADALLAGTILQTGGKLITLNTKHFPMPDLLVARAWG